MISWKTCHFSSQLTRGVNNRGQFISLRYFPNTALLLVRKSRLKVTFLLLILCLPSLGVPTTAVPSNSPNGGHACGGYSTRAFIEYWVQCRFLSRRHFDYLLESEVV